MIQGLRDTSPPLIGRQRESRLLYSCVEEALGGRVGVALVTGEPGIGKTRLLRDCAERATENGALVLHGGASEAEGMPPYLPFLEALGRYVQSAPLEVLRQQVGPLGGPLAELLPELAARLGELPSGYPLPSQQARVRLYEAVGDFLAAVAEHAPLVLILDDLQWADSATLDLLCYVARHQPAARLLVLGAYREGEATANPALERSLVELNRLRVLVLVPLRPLAADDLGAIGTRELGGPLDSSLVSALHGHSEGNAFFAEELLRDWVESGAIVSHDGTFSFTPRLATSLPASVVGVVRQRLTRLAPEVVDVLRAAAIVGRAFDVALLAEVTGQDPDAVEEWLVAAASARVVRADGPGRFSFTHDKVRECLYADVTSVRARRLHGFIGRVLESRGVEDAPALAELAFHFSRSGDRVRGAAYATRAAEQALAAHAPEQAHAAYQDALELTAADDPRRGALLLALGDAALLAGVEREAAATYAEAQAWHLKAGDRIGAGRSAHGAGRARARLEEHAAARTGLETALELLDERADAQVVAVLTDLADLLAVSLGLHDEGMAHGRRALEIAVALPDARLEAVASRSVGNMLVRASQLQEGIELLERALALAEGLDDPTEAAECCACLATAYGWAGALRRAHESSVRRLEHAARSHDAYQLRHAYTWLSMTHFVRGEQAESERMLNLASQAVERLASPEPRAFLQHFRGGLAYFQGDYALADALLTAAIATFRAIEPGALVWYLGLLGLTRIALGDRDAALALLDELDARVAGVAPDSIAAAEGLTYATWMAVRLRERARAASLYPRLLPFRAQYHDFFVERVLGEVKLLEGDLLAADGHLTAAESAFQRAEIGWELAYTRAAQAELVLARGDAGTLDRARELFAQALKEFSHLGIAGEAFQVQARLAELARPTRGRASTRYPAGLSEREVAVVRLVAAGKSNRDIADELALSEKTVANHLTTIFNKTSSDNRAAAAAFAIRHGLA